MFKVGDLVAERRTGFLTRISEILRVHQNTGYCVYYTDSGWLRDNVLTLAKDSDIIEALSQDLKRHLVKNYEEII